MSTPGMFMCFARPGDLAPDARIKPYSAAANGTSWSEGAGTLVLERLSDAQRNGHPVLAVVRGTATNQNGSSNGLRSPNGPAQQRVIKQALAHAGLTPDQVDAVDGHGTGTAWGDPIEAQALIDWSGGLRLLIEDTPWPQNGHPRRAGVTSYGLSGANAHAILEQAPPGDGITTGRALTTVSTGMVLSVVPCPLSGRSESALHEQAARLAAHLEAHPELGLVDVAYSLATTRTSTFEHRAVLVAEHRDDLLVKLNALATGKPATDVIQGIADPGARTTVVFPSQAEHCSATAQALYEEFPTFADTWDDISFHPAAACLPGHSRQSPRRRHSRAMAIDVRRKRRPASRSAHLRFPAEAVLAGRRRLARRDGR